jgi:transposase-like protein
MHHWTIKNRKVLSNNQSLSQRIETRLNEYLTGLINTILLEEFEIFLNRKRYQRQPATGKGGIKIYRNGYRIRNYLVVWSKLLRIKIPRCRNGRYKSLLLSSCKLTDPEVEKLIMQIWAEGGSYRDLQTLVKRIYGEKFSLRTFSRMLKTLDEYVGKYHSREIKHSYDCLFIDGLSITIKGMNPLHWDEYMVKKRRNAVFLGVVGQRKEGRRIIREMIDYNIAPREDEPSYRGLLGSLKKRGLIADKFSLVVHDGEQAISSAIKNVYGNNRVLQQSCLIHKLRNVLEKVIDKTNLDEIRKDVWGVYSSETEEEFIMCHREVYRKWRRTEPEAMKLFKSIDSRMLSKYKFNKLMHRHIHSNNPIERYFKELRRRIKAIGIFENVKSADRLIYLIVEYLNQRRGSIAACPQIQFTH